MPQKKCSFCGRSENEVRLLITGLTGYICEDCAQQANNIVVESGVLGKQSSDVADIDMNKVPKPKERLILMSISSDRTKQNAISPYRFTTITSDCSSQRTTTA